MTVKRVLGAGVMVVLLLLVFGGGWLTTAATGATGTTLKDVRTIIGADSGAAAKLTGTARNLNRSIRGFVIWSIIFSSVSCLVGVWAPMRFEIPVPSGPAIIFVAAIIFLVTMLIRMTVPRFREASI